MRQLLANPATAQKFALGTLLAGGLVAGLGNLIRDLSAAGTAQWTFLLDVIGLLLAIFGAAWDFRTQLRFGDFDPKRTKRRGTILLTAGLVGSFGGCWLLGWVIAEDTQPLLGFVTATIMTSGIGAVIDGFVHIGWFGSGDYLDRRIAQRSQDEW